jgi:hypothetical protein
MQPIEYDIKAIKQNTSECMQTAATQLISYYEPSITVQEVLTEVPIYIDENGDKIGTSPGHLASFFAARGYKTTTHIFDVELFDITWSGLLDHEIVENLTKRQEHIPANSWLAKYHHILVEGWKLYVQQGGTFSFPQLSSKLLYDLLLAGPVLMMVNSTYLNRTSKQLYSKETDKFVKDSIRGRSLTHAVTAAGYKDGKFLIIDPDPPEGIEQHRWIEGDHILASIMAAQTESDNFVISVSK